MKNGSIFLTLALLTFLILSPIYSYANPDRGQPNIAYDSTKNIYLMVYTGFSPGDHRGELLGGIFNADGTPANTEFQISTGTNVLTVQDASVAFDFERNQFLVVWEEYGVGPRVYGRLISVDEVTLEENLGPVFEIGRDLGESVWGQKLTSVAFNPDDNNYLVVWMDMISESPFYGKIYGQIVNANGTLPGDVFNNFRISQDIGGLTNPVVVYDSDKNKFLVAWEDSLSGSSSSIHAAVVSATGGTPSLSSYDILFDPSGLDALNPSLAYESSSNFILAVCGYRDGSIHGKRLTLTATGFNILDTTSIAISDGASCQFPSVASDNLGKYLVVWDDGRGDTPDNIYGQLVNSFNGALSNSGDSFPVSVGVTDEQYPSTVYNSVNDYFAVAFQTWIGGQSENDLIVFDAEAAYGIPAPTNLEITGTSSIAWDAVFAPDLLRYWIHYDTDGPGPPYEGIGLAEGNSPFSVDISATPGYDFINPMPSGTYYLAVTAEVIGGATSRYSNEVQLSAGCTPIIYYRDYDNDTFGDPAVTTESCTQPSGYVLDNTDCDDGDALEHPGQTWYLDADNDWYSEGTDIIECERIVGYKTESELTAISGDCDDNNPDVNPGAIEIPNNGIDEDCLGGDLDTIPPAITLLGANPQVLEIGAAYVELGATATDNVDGDISGSIVIDSSNVTMDAVGTYQVTYNVTDSAGNAADPVVRTVNVVDTSLPATSGHQPFDGQTNVAITTAIVIHITDAGIGVDQDTIVMTVEGVVVFNGADSPSYPHSAITGNASDYTLTYNADPDFGYEQVVNVSVTASDLAGNPMLTDDYSFITETEGGVPWDPLEDSDGDDIPDGVEVELLGTNPNMKTLFVRPKQISGTEFVYWPGFIALFPDARPGFADIPAYTNAGIEVMVIGAGDNPYYDADLDIYPMRDFNYDPATDANHPPCDILEVIYMPDGLYCTFGHHNYGHTYFYDLGPTWYWDTKGYVPNDQTTDHYQKHSYFTPLIYPFPLDNYLAEGAYDRIEALQGPVETSGCGLNQCYDYSYSSPMNLNDADPVAGLPDSTVEFNTIVFDSTTKQITYVGEQGATNDRNKVLGRTIAHEMGHALLAASEADHCTDSNCIMYHSVADWEMREFGPGDCVHKPGGSKDIQADGVIHNSVHY